MSDESSYDAQVRKDLAEGAGAVVAREAPLLVTLGAFLMSGFDGGAGSDWSVYYEPGSDKRPVLLERVDSRYAAEQAVTRWATRIDAEGRAAIAQRRRWR